MRVLQLGVGSVGEVVARTLSEQPEITAVVLADIDEERLARVAPRLAPGKAQRLPLDVRDRDALRGALGEVDLVVNGLIPEHNLEVMHLCLETGTDYLDMAAAGPRDVVGTADVDEELALDPEFEEKGLTALVFFGIDPGATDVFARALYEQLDTVERLTVFDGDAGTVEGYDFAPSFSPATAVEECLILPPHALEDGELVRRSPLTRCREFGFPEPVGPLTVRNVDHEESQLMPMYLSDKGLRDADFYIALPDEWVDLLLVWRKLGFDHNREIEFGSCRFRPLDLLVSRLPRPIDLAGKLHGSVCVGTLAEGTVGGEPVRRFMYQVTSHDEAYARYGVQGTGLQTGIPAACAAMMLAKGLVHERGVLAPERIDPEPFLELMNEHGAPWSVIDLPVET
jgi:saccharopine dehydrogenase-like NADP-dependent oxidoreductase